jgi:hypothetical protein
MSTTTFYNNQNLVGTGNVGIGTTSLGGALDVYAGTNEIFLANSDISGAYPKISLGTGGGFARNSVLNIYNMETGNVVSANNSMMLTYYNGSLGYNAGDPGAAIAFQQRWWSGSSSMAGVGMIRGIKTQINGTSGGGLQFLHSDGTAYYNCMTINHLGQVGIGTVSPLNTLDVYGSQITRNPTIYNTATGGWYNIGLWDGGIGAGGNAGQRLRLELIGGNGYDTNTSGQLGGVTTIYASILNNASGTVANCGGTWKHDGAFSCISSCKFVQNGSNRNQYYVYVNMNAYTQHGLRIDTTQGSAFTPSFTSTSDPGVDSATVRAAIFSMIAGYGGVSSTVGIGTQTPTATGTSGSLLHVYDASSYSPTIVVDSSDGSGQARFHFKAAGSASLFRASRTDYFSNTVNIWTQIVDYTQNGTNDMSFISAGKGYLSGGVLTLTQAGNVGIGTTNPGYQLHVTSNIYNESSGGGFYGMNCGNMNGLIQGVYNGGAANPDGQYNSDIFIGVNYNQQTGQRLAGTNHGVAQIQLVGGNNQAGALKFRCLAAGTGAVATIPTIMTINPTGVGIGTTNPSSYTLQVVGSIGASSDITAYYSDERLKTKTGALENALDKVCSLDTFTYMNNELAKSFGFDDEIQRVGVSAQQVQKVLPEAVKIAPFDAEGKEGSKSGENYLTVQYEKLVPLLIAAIKEQAKQIEDLKKFVS